MNRAIQLPLPANFNSLSVEEQKLMSNWATYSAEEPEIKTLKNVFVSHEGLVLKNGVLVEGCAPNLNGKEDNTFYYPFWRNTIEQYLVSKFGKSLPSIKLKDDTPYLLIHSKWFNYAFWINSFLPRLIQAELQSYFKKCKLIVPESWKNMAYVWETLSAFDVEKEIIPDGHHLFVKRLVMPKTRKWTAAFHPDLIQQSSTRLIELADERSTLNSTPAKVYLTRKNRGIRCVENEQELVAQISQLGFESLSFEDYSVWDQIKIMNNASHFMSLHGAGFTNVMFMQEGSHVVELINKPYAEQEYTFPYWKLSTASKLQYNAIFCELADQKAKAQLKFHSAEQNETDFLVNQNVLVDLSQLKDLKAIK